MDAAKLRYRPHIDGLRGLAVLAVMGFHAFPQFLGGGFLGVDVFFVISGYLISSILYAEFQAPGARGVKVLRNFYGRRIRRIFPALIVVLLSAGVMGYFLLLPGELEKLARQILASAGFWQNFLLARQVGYFAESAPANPLLHLWSLGVEEQFYLLWPLVIWVTLRCRLRLLPVIVFLAACSFCWNAQKYVQDVPAAFYLPQMRLWELAIGAITAILWPRSARAPDPDGATPASPRIGRALLANGLSLAGLALIAAGLVVLAGDLNGPDRWTLLPTVGAACVVGSDDSAWLNRWVLAQPVLVGMGLISYPLYLWHWTLLSFSQLSGEHADSWWLRIAILAASVALAWLTYRWVETPIRHGRQVRGKVAGLAGAMATVAALAFGCARTHGLPSRFPPLIGAISTYNYDPAAAMREGTYFLIGGEDETKFPQDPNEILPGKPTLFLWGDSYAASLYPGLKSVYGDRFNVVQRTVAGTPPMLPEYFSPSNARRINAFILAAIARDRPQYVLLAAKWPAYNWRPVADTIAALKADGVPHIVLVGPAPMWAGSLPQQLFNYVRKHRGAPVPVRMTLGLEPAPTQVDAQMAGLARSLGIEYISLCQILENADGALVRTGDTADSLTSYDSGHLAIKGSEYVVAHFPKL